MLSDTSYRLPADNPPVHVPYFLTFCAAACRVMIKSKMGAEGLATGSNSAVDQEMRGHRGSEVTVLTRILQLPCSCGGGYWTVSGFLLYCLSFHRIMN